MIFAWSIFDIINNVSRWIILYELLLIGFRPFEAAILSSIAASSIDLLCNRQDYRLYSSFLAVIS